MGKNKPNFDVSNNLLELKASDQIICHQNKDKNGLKYNCRL